MVVKKFISRFIQIFTNVVVIVCVHAWLFFSQEIITVAKEQNMYSLCSSRNE